jgi:hypothetical protein
MSERIVRETAREPEMSMNLSIGRAVGGIREYAGNDGKLPGSGCVADNTGHVPNF